MAGPSEFRYKGYGFDISPAYEGGVEVWEADVFEERAGRPIFDQSRGPLSKANRPALYGHSTKGAAIKAAKERVNNVLAAPYSGTRSNSTKRKNPVGITISAEEFDALRKGQRIWINVSTGFQSGEVEFEVGRSSYSKKYDVHSKRLLPVFGGTPKTTGAKWILMKRASGYVGLGHGGGGTIIESFRTENLGKKRTKKKATSKRKNPSMRDIMRDAMK